jgi:hypothetical protein
MISWGTMVRLNRIAKLGCVALLALWALSTAVPAQSSQTGSGTAPSSPLILLSDAVQHGMSERTAHGLDRLFLIWAVLSVAAVGAVIGDAAHARRASWRIYFVWVLSALPFGPIVAVLYFPYGRLLALRTLSRERDPRAVRIVADAVFTAAGSALGVEIAYLLCYYTWGGTSIRSAMGLTALATGGLLMSWLVFHSTLERAERSPQPMQAIAASLPAALASNLLSLAAILTVLALAQTHWPGLFRPSSVAFHAALWTAALAAAFLNLPLSTWRTLTGQPTWPPR